MRKFKEVKRKEIIYSLSEWKQIEKAAAKVSMQTSEYIRRMSLDGKVVHLEMEGVTPVINAMRIMGNNINQIAKKANEINSIYADDVGKLKEIQEGLCHILNLYVSTLMSKAA
ncbi:MAG: MobC family plasmid mobilization relaxosome protein [Ruminococcus sp.]|nr:MobC family plasmid mobilization relaxosome protein [Ruminococcus sp.]